MLSKAGAISHTRAVLCALLVTVLWSSSWILIKIGMDPKQDPLPPLPFAGLRYMVAFLCLLPCVLASREHRATIAALTRQQWGQLIALGLVMYSITQGAQFAALALLPSAAVSLLLNLTSPLVAVAGIWFLNERPRPLQWAGLALSVAGVLTYFGITTGTAEPLPAAQWKGILVGILCMVSNTASALMGRTVNRETHLSPLLITTVSMGIGAIVLLGGGIALQGIPHPTLKAWGIIAWLALFNTAFAFTLWNYALRALSAMEASLLNSTMLIQICLLAWRFRGETLTTLQIFGVALTGFGVLLVQLRLRSQKE